MAIRQSQILFTSALLAALALSSAPAARAQDVSMRAYFRNMDTDHGKCTVEVEVDSIVEIEFSGENGRMHTLSGQPGTWRRFECNGAIPARPTDFRFQGVDGRGHVQLIRDPRQNRGVAVVRIEDSQGGREGYTFDLEWQDAPTGGPNGGNFPGQRPGPPPGPGRGDRRDGRFDNDRDSFVVACDSNDGRRHYCGVGVDSRGGGVRLLRQRSGAACVEGSTWGYDRRGIWVDRGCRAEFSVRR